jgi:hypothetical protein
MGDDRLDVREEEESLPPWIRINLKKLFFPFWFGRGESSFSNFACRGKSFLGGVGGWSMSAVVLLNILRIFILAPLPISSIFNKTHRAKAIP